jgi:hypothetical protein
VSAASFGSLTATEVVETAKQLEFRADDLLSLLALDEFSYCRDGAAAAATVAGAVDDLPDVDPGLALGEMLTVAETIPEPLPQEEDQRALGPEGLEVLFKAAPIGNIDVSHFKGMVLSSSLPEGEHYYLYARHDFTPVQLGWGKSGKLFLDVTPGLNVQMMVMFLDSEGERLGHVVLAPQTNQEFDIPPAAAHVRLGFRISGPGLTTVRPWCSATSARASPPGCSAPQSPRADNLSGADDLSQRVRSSPGDRYAARGLRTDVCCLRPNIALRYHEFEGVDVVRGGKAILEGMLALRRHRAVLVHFLDEAMWKVLQPHLGELQIIVWVHGSEIQPWHRRRFDYSNELELDAAKVASDARMRFWRSVLTTPPPNLKLVFVSQYFADEVQEIRVQLPRSSARSSTT